MLCYIYEDILCNKAKNDKNESSKQAGNRRNGRMAKIVRQTLREQVTQAIRLKLLTGELKPGTRIVEQDMAQDLGVSRGPVREALRQIEQEGLVEYTSHVGCSVKDFTAQDVYEVYLLRANLEILSVKMCEGIFSERTLSKMACILNKMQEIRDIEQFDEIIENDNEFHACIVRECKLDRLYTLWNSMSGGNTIVFYRGAGKSEYVVRNQYHIHKQVLDALKTGQVEKISAALTDHYMETIKGYLIDHNTSPEEFPYKINIRF